MATGGVGVARAVDGELGLVPRTALVAQPWANGGGMTRIIVEGGDFRLSLATIDRAGPFSRFAGMVRHFAVIAGQVVLRPYGVVLDRSSDPFRFSGDDPVLAELPAGPAYALNLIAPDDRLRLERHEAGTIADAHAIFALDALIAGGLALQRHDTVLPVGAVIVSGPVLVVR